MPQYAYPSADTYLGTWKDQGGGGTNIYTTIDEPAPRSDADYIESIAKPLNAPYVTKLTAVIDPGVSTGHVLHVAHAKDSAAGDAISLVVELRQGYVNEGTPGTLIATWTYNNISEVFTQKDEALTGPQADAITDYSNLYLRFVANQG